MTYSSIKSVDTIEFTGAEEAVLRDAGVWELARSRELTARRALDAGILDLGILKKLNLWTSKLNKIPSRVAHQEQVRRESFADLAVFTRLMWPILNPGTQITWSWHMDIFCETLMRITRGELKRVIFNVPPGSTKSTIISIMWPCWEWLQHPEHRWICASHAEALATKLNRERRKIIQSKLYQDLFSPSWTLRSDQKNKTHFENTRNGWMISAMTSSGGVIGSHCDRMVIDDPISRDELATPRLKGHVAWYAETASSRFRSLKDAVIVVVMQRLHQQDLTGYLLESDEGYEHIVIPAEYDPERAQPWDPRRREGESFFPARFGKRELEAQKRKLGSLQYAAQYQQTPQASGGNLIREDWWKRWERLPSLDGAQIIGSVDCAYEGTDRSDFSVIQVWAAVGPNAYLLDQTRGRWEFVGLEKELVKMCRRWPKASRWLVEERAMGSSLISRMRRMRFRIQPFKSQSSKEQRVQAISPLIEAGQVWIPADDGERPGCLERREAWSLPAQLKSLITECSLFPLGAHDDQVDAMSMALDALAPGLGVPDALPPSKGDKPEPRRRRPDGWSPMASPGGWNPSR